MLHSRLLQPDHFKSPFYAEPPATQGKHCNYKFSSLCFGCTKVHRTIVNMTNAIAQSIGKSIDVYRGIIV